MSMSTPCLTKEKNERDPGPTFLSHFSNAFSLIVEDVRRFPFHWSPPTPSNNAAHAILW